MVTFVDAIEQYDSSIGLSHDDYVLFRKRLEYKMAKYPNDYQDIALMTKKLGPVNKPASGSGASSAMMGLSVGLVGVIAVVALAKKCQNKSNINPNQECLL